MRKDLIVSTLAVVFLFTTPLLAAEVDLALEAALCPVSPTEGALAMASCSNFCTELAFSPQSGVVCTWDRTCTGHGSSQCCNYSCGCGDSTGLPGTPLNACPFSLPPQCLFQFSPRFGIVCTALGTCQEGSCCQYTCSCGGCDVPLGTPANACGGTLPTGCCPGGHTLCPKSYCDGEGVRCEACGCEVGCCAYKCGIPDPTCTAPDPIPLEAC